MKQILIAGNVAYPTAAADYLAVDAGAIAVFNKGALVAAPTGTGDPVLTDTISIVLGRSADNGGPISINEIDLKTLNIVKGAYKAATKFTAAVTIPTPVIGKDYTIIVMKKGVQFNERATWTSTIQAVDGDTATTLAEKLVKSINGNTIGSEVTATNAAGKITITAVKSGADYNIVPADKLTGVAVTDVTIGFPAYGDKAFVANLASEAAADRGFEYTYRDGDSVNPGYPMAVDASSYTIYTLHFANHRKTGTRDEPTKQYVTIAVPTGAAQITTLDKIFALDRK